MAKQKGIHQLKGKVGGMSYYQQSGVTDGLVRRIPEGLSGRVKTGDEYANTRLNNDEFKNGNAMATFAFRAVPNRKASMMRRFAIAEMTKSALEFIKAGTGRWGLRIPTATFDNIVVDMLERHAKSGPYAGEFGLVTLNADQGEYNISVTITDELVTDLQSKGITGFYAICAVGAMSEVLHQDGFVRQIFGIASPTPHDIQVVAGNPDILEGFTPTPGGLGLSPEGYATALQTANNGMFAIISFIPYRTISSQRHSLYEYATFTVVPMGAIPGGQ